MHAATPLALSLRLTRCERTSQSNGKQTIQSTTRSHLAKSSYRSFVFEIHSTYVEVPTHIVSSIVRFVPPQESTYREAAAFVHQDDRGLHGEPSGRFGPEDKNSSSNLRQRKRRSGDKKAGGETHRKRTKQGGRVDTTPQTRRQFIHKKRAKQGRRVDTSPQTRRQLIHKLTTPEVLGRDGARRGGRSICVSCNSIVGVSK